MARSIDTDLYSNFRFNVVETGGNLDPVAGFTKVTIPKIDVKVAEYREGVYKWTRKFPGIPSVSDVTLTTGVVKKDSAFYRWLLKPVDGGQTYRSDVTIQEFHISDVTGLNGSPSRIILLKEAFPMSFSPGTDLDASSSEVQTQEITLAVEEIDVEIIAS